MKIGVVLAVCFILIFILGAVVILLGFSNYLTDSIKGSPFECGFSSLSGLGVSFSMPFFIISLMFLLFDVEILLVSYFPLTTIMSLNLFVCSVMLFFFIFFATLYEWAKGVLSWV